VKELSVLLKALLLIGWLLGSVTWAAEVPGLYETEVIADSQSIEDRDAAIKSALQIVLNRVMAGDNLFQDAVLKAALANAPHFVKQYQFALQESGLGSNANARTLRVLFDEEALLNLMKTSKLEVWEETRPETLVWLVVEENGQRSLFRPEAMYEINNAVNKMSKQVGLPLLLPLQDLEEQRQISVNDVLSAYPQRLLSVSERYGVVSVLAGRVVKTADCWKADWSLYFDNRIVQTETPCTTLNEAVLAGMQGVYDKLSKYYAVKPVGLEIGSVTLNIAQVYDESDKNRVLNYLKSLPMVKTVSWVGTEANRQRCKVSFNGGRAALEETLGLGRVLNPQDLENTGTNELSYELLPLGLN
jgi:uncharacterized protein